MRDPKYPARQIIAWSFSPKMLEEGQEHLLNHIFGIVWLKSKRSGIPQKTYTKKVVKVQNLIFR